MAFFIFRYAQKHGHAVLQHVTLPRIGAMKACIDATSHPENTKNGAISNGDTSNGGVANGVVANGVSNGVSNGVVKGSG